MLIRLMRKMFGYCPQCGRYLHWPKRRRMNTAYIDDKCNYSKTCLVCYRETIAYYNEMWRDYYNSVR